MWTLENIKQVLLDLSLKVSESPFLGVKDLYRADNADWKDDIGLDSIEIMQLAAYVNSFFNVYEMNNAPYLLSSSKVNEWADYIHSGNGKTVDTINFLTSGTTGNAKTIRHTGALLNREIEFLATIFKEATHIIPFIPAYSIYGFLTTVGLPARLNIPLLYPSEADWRRLPPKSLIVATPFHWNWLLDSFSLRSSCFGISSTAPLHNDMFKSLSAKGVAITDLYGSTETAGVAYRQHWRESFKLFPYLKFSSKEDGDLVEDCDTHNQFGLLDTIEKTGPDTFTITGRKDNKVKIAGVLTDLDQIRKVINSVQGIKDCIINAKSIGNQIVLMAEISLNTTIIADEPGIKNQIRSLLRPHEFPRIINFTLREERAINR